MLLLLLIPALATTLLAHGTAAEPAAAASASLSADGESPLNRWLGALDLTLPDIHQTLSGFQVDLTNVHLKQIGLDTLESKRTPPPTAGGPTTMTLTVDGLKATLSVGTFAFRQVAFPHTSGSGSLSVALHGAGLSAVSHKVTDN